MKFILGKKLGMSQIFKEDGKVVPVTLIEAGPVTVTDIRSNEKNGYSSIQVGYVNKKNGKGFRHLREIRVDDHEYKQGDVIDVTLFNEDDLVKVRGTSKGKGFQGVMKRHNFSGMPASHGHKHVKRHAGSIGQRFPQHTLKGMRMPGQMGNVKATVRGLKVVKVDKDKNLILIKGAVPGNNGSLVEIRGL